MSEERKQWEYHVYGISGDDEMDQLNGFLNEAGEKGWEVVTSFDHKTEHVLLLKRPRG